MAFTTAAAAVVGIAVHASEAAAHLYDLSKSTGVAVQDLSGLGVIGKLAGIDIETLAKGLERMDRTALVAAKSPNAVSNAYRQLGISVLDSTGHLKPTVELFGEVADKFSNMEDGATKTALAMQIFGRAGANLIPVLDKGSEAIKYWVGYATSVGAVMTDKAAAGAHAFQDELTKLNLIQTGVQNGLMTALLPALDHITEALATFLAKGDTIKNFGETVGKVLVGLAKIVFEAAYAWDWWGDHLAILGGKIADFAKEHPKIAGVLGINWMMKETGADQLSKEQIDKAIADAKTDLQKQQDKLTLELADLSSPNVNTPGPPGKKGTGRAPVTTAVPKLAGIKPEADVVGELVSKEELATAAEVSRLGAVDNTMAALLLQKGATEAIQKIEETRLTIGNRLKALQEEEKQAVAANATEKVAAIKKQEDALTAQLTVLDASKQKLVALFDTREVAAYIVATHEALTKENEDLQQVLDGMKRLVAASQEGGQALINAQIEDKLDKDKEKIQEEQHALDLLRATQGADAAQVDALSAAVARDTAELERHRALLEQEHQLTVETAEAKYNLSATYKTEMLAIDEEMAAAKKNNDVIAQTLLLAEKQSKTNALTTQWDNAALAVGTFGQKAQAVLNELNIQAQGTGKNIAQSFKTFFDGVSTQFAQMVVTGKYNFNALFTALEEQIVKELASKALSGLLNKLAGLIPGLGGGGSSSGGGGGGGGILGFIGSLFGGGKAAGGGVSPGVSYLVGEQGPEQFVPGVPGNIVPNQASAGATAPAQVHSTIIVQGVQDVDGFRKSGPQIAAQMWRHLQVAAARSGGG